MKKITDFAGRIVSYVYSNAGDLISITAPPTADYPDGTSTTYTYTNHNLETITDPKGQVFVTNHYDSNDRVDWQIYGIDKSIISYLAPNQAMVTDPKGNKTIYTFNENGNTTLKEEQNQTGAITHKTYYEYDSSMEMTKITYPNGNSVEYKYDSQLAQVKTWEFNSDSNAEGWHPIYNVGGLTVSEGFLKFSILGNDPHIGGPGIDIAANSNQQVQVRYKIDTGDSAQLFWAINGGTFTGAQHVDFNIMADGQFHTYVISVGALSSIWNGRITQLRFDPNISSAGYVEVDYIKIVEEIPRNGNLLEILRRKPGVVSEPYADDIVTAFTYEPRFNKIKTITDPRGNITTYTYDYELSQTDPNYGERGNLVKVTYPSIGGQTIETTFTYNAYGQVETITDPEGNIAKYEYYPDTGYLKKIISGYGVLNITTEMTYDAVGNIASRRDPNGNIVTFEYDSHNNHTKTTSPLPFDYVIKYKYDANDNLIQFDRETGDSFNPWQTTYYTYDILDRVETIKDELNNVATFTYDGNGSRNSVKDAENNTTTYQYDERNLLWKITDALGNVTEYAYDNNGNLKQIKDAKGNITVYSYDDFDRLIKTTYADNSFEEYTYDAASNLVTKKDPKGQIIYYDYDTLNRLSEKGLSPKGTVPDSVVSYTYDRGSRLMDVIDSNGTIHYNYDNINRITQVISPGNKYVSYEYDANSNRTRLTYPDSTYISYEYDQLNRLMRITQGGQVLSQYTYDSLNRRARLDYANNTQTIYQYDGINRLTNLVNKINSGTNISTFNYAYDKIGNRTSMTTLDGIYNYSYDKIYQLKGVDYPDGFSLTDTTFNYDPVGNRTSTVNGGTTTYTTNNLNQYTQAGTINYTYDLNGNLISDGTFTHTYDYENRLISASRTETNAAYKYDAFGRRIEREVNGTTIKFTYDGDQIIAEYDNSGNLVKKHIYGTGIDETLLTTDYGLSTNYYYHYDGLGSVTNLSNSSGATTEAYSYDSYGNPSTTSTLGNRYMFTGREYDAETGLYYYRARYYSPVLGRFLQRDPVGYVGGVNLYGYVGNNSVNAIDPLGLITVIIHGMGYHPPGYSGGVGKVLAAAGEEVIEIVWSGNVLNKQIYTTVTNKILEAKKIAEARGENLNVIGHSWGTVIAGEVLHGANIKVDNLISLGSPYLDYSNIANKWINFWSPIDPISWPSSFRGMVNQRQYDIYWGTPHLNYWDHPDVIKKIARELKGKK